MREKNRERERATQKNGNSKMGTCIKLVLTLSMLCYSILSLSLSTHAHIYAYIYRCLISTIYVWQSLCSSIYVHSHFRYFSTLHSVCNKFSGETLNINLLLCPFFSFSISLFLHLVFGVCVVHESQTWMLAVHE